MKPTLNTSSNETQKAIDEWLAKGNKIEQVPYGKSEIGAEEKNGFYGRKKKPVQESTET